jgi:hypothetical protein
MPRIPIDKPGAMKIGLKIIIPSGLESRLVVVSTSAINIQGRLLSIVAISWVHLVMILDVGVLSSHLINGIVRKAMTTRGNREDRRVLPSIESNNRELIVLEDLKVPKT